MQTTGLGSFNPDANGNGAPLLQANPGLTPPLIITEDQIGEIIEKVTKVIRATA